jgi:hypothetical protein
MRKTKVLWTHRPPFSHHRMYGKSNRLNRSIAFAIFFVYSILLLPNVVSAQGPYCPGFNCTANDVQNPSYFLGNATGTPIVSIACTPGDPVSGVYLWMTFQVTATNRYDINVIGDVYVEGLYDHTFDICLGDYNSGIYTVMLEPIVWPCGADMVVQNTLFAWAVNNGGVCQTCPDQSSKCHRFSTLTIATPLVADFSNTFACVAGQTYETYTFTNQSSGGVSPYSYSWNFGTGATPATATTVGPHTVNYSSGGIKTIALTVTDNAGTTSVRSYDINVQQATGISITINDASICAGGTAMLTAVVTGGAVSVYQWQQLISSVWTNVGTNQNTYTTAALAAGTYTYRVIGNPGTSCSAVSPNAVVTVAADPTVSIAASDLSICDGGTTTFTATVSGGNGTSVYQWQYNNAGTWTNVGTNSNVYTTPVLTTGSYTYRLQVTQDAGCFVQSADQTVVVSADPTVSVSATNSAICVGGTTTLTATPTGGNGTTTYQWQQLIGAVWSIVGTNSNTYSPGTMNTAGTFTYRVFITQDPGCSATSANAVIVVSPDLSITTQPTSITECIGGTQTMTVAVTGGSGAISYQWQQSPNGSSSWTNATGSGSTTAIYTPPSTVAGVTYYRVTISAANNGCGPVTSNNATATIIADLAVTTQPTNLTECIGGTGTMTVAVSGGTGTISYQWQSSPNGTGSWINASGTGSTTATYTPPSTVAGTTYYRVLINATGNGCGQAVSNNATATIVADLSVSTQPTSITECIGGTQTMTVTVTGGTGTISYQWQSSPDGTGSWANASGTGSTTATYTPPSTVAGTTYYRVLINATGNGCGQAVSNNATAIITADITITTQPTNVTECIGGTETMTVAVSGGSGTISYQWQQSPTGSGSWTDATGAGSTTSTFTPPSTVAGTTYYRVLINASNAGCDQAISNNATAVISPDLTITTQPTNVVECIGGTATMTVVISGGSGTISYLWQSSPDGSTNWVNASGSGSTTSTYTPSSTVVGTTYYRVLINAANSGCDQVISNNATAIITPDLSITTHPTGFEECVGGIMTLEVSSTGGTGTITYQWQQSPTGSGSWTNASGAGANTSIYTPASDVAGTMYYRAIISATGSGCDNVISNTAIVIITPDLVITAHPNNVIECVGGASLMSVVVEGGIGIVTFQWQQSADGISGWSDIAGATASTYIPPSTTPGITYYRVIVNSN